MLDRRQFVRLGALGGSLPLLPGRLVDDDGFESPPTRPFVAPLPLPGPPNRVAPFAASSECEEELARLFGGPPPPSAYYSLVTEEALVSLHPDLPRTPVWRYRDESVPATSPFLPGPTFQVRMGVPQVVRMRNALPPDHVGFGVPYTTVHNHGIHAPALFDGFPDNVRDNPVDLILAPGETYDYCYPMQDVGFADGRPAVEERPSTLWYHDHLLDFTAPNVHRGLAAFFTVFDELDTGDERTGLRLPSGRYDVPLVLQDRRIASDGTLVYTPGDFDGFLGDKLLVNGAIQPYFEVERRKYRFRVLDGANARFFGLMLVDERGRSQPFDVIGADSRLLSRPLRDERFLFIAPAERREVVIDFSRYRAGTVLHLEDFVDQPDGRGPKGSYDDPELIGRGRQLLELRVVGGDVPDPSRVPDVLRPLPPISQEELRRARRRTFEFERRRGAWAINDQFVDLEDPLVTARSGEPQIWTFKNGGGGWWHPIHVHLEFMRILKRNGRTPGPIERDGIAAKDVASLGGGDEVEVFLKFRDFRGSWVFHCHNLEHEDHFMMARFDVV